MRGIGAGGSEIVDPPDHPPAAGGKRAGQAPGHTDVPPVVDSGAEEGDGLCVQGGVAVCSGQAIACIIE